jgi:dynein heavy chain 1
MLREIQQQQSRQRTSRNVKKLDFKHKPLMDKLQLLRKFRFEHNQLANVIAKVLKPRTEEDGEEVADLMNEDDLDAIEEVKLAYDEMKSVDILDLSEQGTQAWEIAKRNYDERIDRVEETIIARLRDQLGQAKSSAEMFRIFKRFNVLFVRQRIRGAIRAYQKQLIARVKEDIKALHTKFKVQYQRSNNSVMSEVRDIPPVSGQIIWAKQIERQLDEYLQRVEDVLGQGWENHVEGRELKEDGDFFKSKLHRANPAEQYIKELESKKISFNDTIFDIELYRGETTRLELFVNFHDRLITMAKEIRNLKWLRLRQRVPLPLAQKANEVNKLYPYVISLKASVKTYTQTVDKLDKRPHLRPLVASWYSNAQNRLAFGIRLKWSDSLESYTYTLAHEVNQFQDHIESVFKFDDDINEVLEKLATCEYSSKAFQQLLHQAQLSIDALREERFINLTSWTRELNTHIEHKLLGRLQQAVSLWGKALAKLQRERVAEWDEDEEGDEDDLPSIKTSTHELQLHAQTMTLKPPVEKARAELFRQLQEYANVIVNQRCLRANAEPKAVEGVVVKPQTYASLLRRLPNDGADLTEAYRLINTQMEKMQTYVQSWLQYQALWDLQVDTVYNRLGGDFEAWQSLLIDIKRSRQHIDTAETVKRFGSAEIDYTQVGGV